MGTNNVAACFELKTGKQVWRERLGMSWGSLVAAEGRLFVTSFEGECYVLAAGPKYEQLAVNRLEERVLSSIAISNGDLFMRTYQHLWCIAEKK